jgi:hypothetical protein
MRENHWEQYTIYRLLATENLLSYNGDILLEHHLVSVCIDLNVGACNIIPGK